MSQHEKRCLPPNGGVIQTSVKSLQGQCHEQLTAEVKSFVSAPHCSQQRSLCSPGRKNIEHEIKHIHNYTQLTWTALQLLQLFDLNLSLLEKRLHILLSHLLEHCGQRSKLYRLYTASLAMSGCPSSYLFPSCRHNCN